MTTFSSLRFTGMVLVTGSLLLVSCQSKKAETTEAATDSVAVPQKKLPKPKSEPLVTEIYTADPSAHVFNSKIYIYPSHDIESGIPQDDLGSHFDMKDYHILSMDSIGGKV